jgi:hypothetical protein
MYESNTTAGLLRASPDGDQQQRSKPFSEWAGDDYDHREPCPVTKEEFRQWLEHFNLTQDEFAWLTGYDRRTVSQWGSERTGRARQSFPRWVPLLFDAWELCGGPPQRHPWDDPSEFEVRITPGRTLAEEEAENRAVAAERKAAGKKQAQKKSRKKRD